MMVTGLPLLLLLVVLLSTTDWLVFADIGDTQARGDNKEHLKSDLLSLSSFSQFPAAITSRKLLPASVCFCLQKLLQFLRSSDTLPKCCPAGTAMAATASALLFQSFCSTFETVVAVAALPTEL